MNDNFNEQANQSGSDAASDLHKKQNKKKRAGNQVVILAVSLVAIAATVFSLIGSYAIALFVLGSKKNDDTDHGAVIVFRESEDAPVLAGSAAEVYQNVADSVVVINASGTVKKGDADVLVSGAGSGVIISSNDDVSYIITNHHVVDGFDKVVVGLTDGRRLNAAVVGIDWMTDIAVLRIAAGDLPTACIGKSDNLHPGQAVVAIGNPLGTLSGSITDGLVSGPIQREITVNGIAMSLIQSSTPVSPGNSGGGLFNMYSELVGIVNAKYTSAGAECISFAIPTSTVTEVVTHLMEKGYVPGRATLPLSFTRVLSGVGDGYLVYVEENFSYNESKGEQQILEGDRIVAVNQTPIADVADIRGALANVNADGTELVEVTVFRSVSEQFGPFVTQREKQYTFSIAPVEYRGASAP